MPGIENLKINNKKVIVRVDFNVPLKQDDDKNQQIADAGRIEKTLPTIEHLLLHGASLILITHLGRPKSPKDHALSTKVLAQKLQELLPENSVSHVPYCSPDELESKIGNADVVLLENIRYYDEETSENDKERLKFAKKLAKLGDLFVNDAFGASHRAHATVKELAEIMPSYAGFLLKKEIKILSTVLNNPARPFVAIIGGAKVSSKIGVLSNLITKVDSVLVGGAMAYTFLKSKGLKMGDSLTENDFLSQAFQVNDKANYNETGFYLPDDHIIADEYSPKAKVRTATLEIPDGWMGMDIGPKTLKKFEKIIKDAKTILWNGPMGVFEMPPFANGTLSIAKLLSKSKATTIVGGGDSMAAIKMSGLEDSITHISTGGGATLEFLEGKKLPGVESILKKE